MSGMYNLVLGDGHEYERGSFVLALLGLRGSDVGRFRDAWLERYGDDARIAIYTRNGGNNRVDHEAEIATMRANPHFLEDRDDEFDSTYATFYFSLPTEDPGYEDETEWRKVRAVLLKHAGPVIDTDQRWLDAIEAVRRAGR